MGRCWRQRGLVRDDYPKHRATRGQEGSSEAKGGKAGDPRQQPQQEAGPDAAPVHVGSIMPRDHVSQQRVPHHG